MIIFLYGEDSFRSGQKLLQIKEKFLTSSPSGAGLSVFDCEEDSFKSRLLDILGMPNLLNPKRLVIVKNLISGAIEADREEVLNYFKKNSRLSGDTDLVVIFFENELPRKTNALFKFLEKNSKSQNFEKLSGTKLNQWVLKRLKELNAKANLTHSALEKLVAFSGENTHVLNSEIQKLVNYCGEKMIEEQDIDDLVSSKISIGIFDTIDALGNNNKKEAARLLHEHLKQGENPFYIFSMFVYQFRNLLKVADLKEKGMLNDYEISKNSGLHPFVVKKSLGQLRNLTFSKLKNIYKNLSELDTKIKTGKIDIQLALDKFLIEL
jgi:DNA polymerase-3 subunit delta